MKALILTTIVLFNINFVNAQNLLVGFTIPNEVLNLNSGSFSYDTVILFNNATLNISNQTNFVVNELVALLGTSELNVENSYFEINNIFSTQDYSTANLKDSLNLSCNLYVSENSALYIESAIVDIPMTFKSEFGWYGFNNSFFDISNSSFNLGSGALDGSFTDSTTFTQLNNVYTSTMLPMTFGVAGNAIVSLDSCQGGMEFVIAQNADVNIQNSDFFMIWYTFGDGDTAYYDYPPSNSTTYLGSSNITGVYSFSDLLANVSGVDYSVDIQNTDGVFWGIISKENSDVIVSNSSLLACGFYFEGTIIDTASGFVNSQLYATYNSPFSDRGFTLNNSSVNAWNFYQADSSDLAIEGCVYGESIGFGEGITRVYNSTCDGKGGYFGGMNNSKTFVYNSEMIRVNGSAQILNFQDSSFAWFHKSKITGEIILSGNSQLYFGNTEYSNNPVVNQNSYFAEAWLDSITNAYTNSIINITGKVWGINGLINNSNITRYIVEYSSLDSIGFVSIKDTSAASFNIINNNLANWNTQGLSAGNHLLWLTIFVDGDTVITCNRELTLDFNTGLNEEKTTGYIYIYPNPAKGLLNIKTDLNYRNIKLSVFTLLGERILTITNQTEIDINSLSSGTYFLKFEIDGETGLEKFFKIE